MSALELELARIREAAVADLVDAARAAARAAMESAMERADRSAFDR
jgi:hypothetical protein